MSGRRVALFAAACVGVAFGATAPCRENAMFLGTLLLVTGGFSNWVFQEVPSDQRQRGMRGALTHAPGFRTQAAVFGRAGPFLGRFGIAALAVALSLRVALGPGSCQT